MKEKLQLKSKNLCIDFSDIDQYLGTRFEHFHFIKQVVLDKTHTFLGIEKTINGQGTGGVGLMSGWLWKAPEQIKKIRNQYPILGVGVVNLKDNEQYSIRENYPVEFVQTKQVMKKENLFSCELFQKDFYGYSYKILRTFEVKDNKLILKTRIENLGEKKIIAEQFCHNFLMFDQKMIYSSYKISLYGIKDLNIVRGKILLDKDYYFPKEFEQEQGSLALSFNYASDKSRITRIENKATGTFVEIEDSFTSKRFYHWLSNWCLSPESFVELNLEKNETEEFSKTYTFGYC